MKAPKSLPKQFPKPCGGDIPISDAHHAIACGFEERGASIVVRSLIPRVVDVAFEFDHQSLCGTIEIDDEAVEDMLAPELEA